MPPPPVPVPQHSSSGGGTKCASGGSGSRLAHARHVHQEVCSLLLAAYESLQTRLVKYMKLLPHWQRAPLQTKDCLQRFNTLSDFAKVSRAPGWR